jgi:hypothetical protein
MKWLLGVDSFLIYSSFDELLFDHMINECQEGNNILYYKTRDVNSD